MSVAQRNAAVLFHDNGAFENYWFRAEQCQIFRPRIALQRKRMLGLDGTPQVYEMGAGQPKFIRVSFRNLALDTESDGPSSDDKTGANAGDGWKWRGYNDLKALCVDNSTGFDGGNNTILVYDTDSLKTIATTTYVTRYWMDEFPEPTEVHLDRFALDIFLLEEPS